MRSVAVILPLPSSFFKVSLKGFLLFGTEQSPDPFFGLRQYLSGLGAELPPNLLHLSVSLLDDLANRLPLEGVQVQLPFHPFENHPGHGARPTPHHTFQTILVDKMRRYSSRCRTQQEDKGNRCDRLA
jgi:hypothetical protein